MIERLFICCLPKQYYLFTLKTHTYLVSETREQQRAVPSSSLAERTKVSIDPTIEKLVASATSNGKFLAYQEIAKLLSDEIAKHPTTSGQTLTNLIEALDKLVHSTK
jgi:predicted HAD superfamily Cof-like phosphohydrolase